MSKKYLTILILSNDSSKTRQWKLPVGLYRAVKLGLLLLAVAIGYVAYDYGNMRTKFLAYNDLKRENISQKIELNAFTAQMAEVEQQLVRLEVFDKKLRIIANLELPETAGSDEMEMGMGGLRRRRGELSYPEGEP